MTEAFDRRVPTITNKKPWLNRKQTVKVAGSDFDGVVGAGKAAAPTTGLAAELSAAAVANSRAFGDGDLEAHQRQQAVPISEQHMRNPRKGNDGGKSGGGQSRWNEKEKRKRDQDGMSGRGKSHNEEEKRILRQGAGGGYD